MKNIISFQSVSRKDLLLGGMIAALLFVSLLGASTASAAIVTSLDLGSTGSQVTELQTYLATNSSIYPSGLVTGYFGPLTAAGVQRFQIAQGIVTSGTPATTGFGRVGPTTMARINALMGSNVPPVSQTSWDTVPVMSAPAVQYGNTNASISWSTNEATQGQVYYSNVALVSNEATGPNQTPYISGSLAIDTTARQTGHTVSLANLQPNTTYYYIVRSIDSVGNITMTMPSTFRTNN